MNIYDALLKFARQRPGFEPGNYASWRDYRNECREVTRDLHDVRELLGAARYQVDAVALEDSLRKSSGRLTLKGSTLDYCTGQYFPTEYRPAVARVLASALWNKWAQDRGYAPGTADALRAKAHRYFSRRVARLYFN